MGNPFIVDTSPLYQQARPSALSQGMAGSMDILAAIMERRRREEQEAKAAQAKAAELQFRRDQESRVAQHQQAQDKWERDKFAQQQRAAGSKATYDAYREGGPEGAGIVAQGYGGTVAPKKPDLQGVGVIQDIQDDPSSPLGFSYDMNPEHERRVEAVKGRHVLQMPDAPEVDLGGPKATRYDQMRAGLAQLPDSAEKAARLRAISEAEALELGGKEGGDYYQRSMGQFDANARHAAALAARKKTGGGAPSARQGQKDLNQQLLTEGKYDNIVQKVLTNSGYKEVNTSGVKMGDMARTIAGASDNAALAAIGGGQFVKMAQGGTGVISDSDMRVFWSRIGGYGVRGEQAFNDAVSGKLGEDKKNAVLAAVQELEAKAKENMNDIGARIASRLASTPGGEEMIPTYLQTYAPDYLPKWQAQRQQRPAPGGTAKGVPKALAPADASRLQGIIQGMK